MLNWLILITEEDKLFHFHLLQTEKNLFKKVKTRDNVTQSVRHCLWRLSFY